MRTGRIVAAVAGGLFVIVSLSACGPLLVEGGTDDPQAIDASDNQRFLDKVGLRGQIPDEVVIAEGRKVCDALRAGKTDEQLRQMIQTDLDSSVDVHDFIFEAKMNLCNDAF